jgi:hypothetical protein
VSNFFIILTEIQDAVADTLQQTAQRFFLLGSSVPLPRVAIGLG